MIGVERETKQGGELADCIFGAPGIGWNQRCDGVERVEEKMRMDARLERRKAGLGQKLVGAFLLHLMGTQLKGCELESVPHGLIE